MVQDYWNKFENKLLKVIEDLIPLCKDSLLTSCSVAPPVIKNKINLRKRLHRRYKTLKNPETNRQINELSVYIKRFYHDNKSKQVRRIIKPGDSRSLWKAVRSAKDTNVMTLPKCMFRDGIAIDNKSLPDEFASFFDSKINELLSKVSVNNNVFNCEGKVNTDSVVFMDRSSVKECIANLKSKNSEGYDRIPQKIMVDGGEYLLEPFTELFKLIYQEKKEPGDCKNYANLQK
jgi:hypothetical protein